MGVSKQSTNTMTRFSKNFFGFLVIGLILSTLHYSCRKNDLDSYNPTLTAANERDLGNRLQHVVLNNPNTYNYLSSTEFPEVYNYLNTALWMVENQTEIKGYYDWEIIVLDDDIQNAFSFPGGKIFITTGLLKYLEGEHQLIAFIAHEAYYIDRENDGAPNSLSLIMQKMKSSFTNNRGLGTKAFIDAIDGDFSLTSDMILEAKSASYDPSFVFEADAFSINMICENYLYPPTGISEILNKAELENNTEFKWLNNKPPSLVFSKPPNFTLETRSLNLDEQETPCINNEIEGSTTFQEIIDMLP